MKFPFVSREMYETAIADRNALIAILQAQVVDAREELRLSRLAPPEKAPSAVSVEIHPTSPDEKRIRRAINDNSMVGDKIDTRLQSHLRSYATKLKKQGVSTEEIEAKLSTWTTSEPSDLVN